MKFWWCFGDVSAMFGRVLLFLFGCLLDLLDDFWICLACFFGSLSVSEKFGRINLVNLKIDLSNHRRDQGES